MTKAQIENLENSLCPDPASLEKGQVCGKQLSPTALPPTNRLSEAQGQTQPQAATCYWLVSNIPCKVSL